MSSSEMELSKKNMEISFEFSRYVLANPELGEKIQENALIVFEVADDPELTAFNRSLAQRTREPNQPVITVWIKGLASSRLLEPKLSFAGA